MFSKVKNVNVESLKNDSKLLDFFVARRSDESRHLLLPFLVLRFLRTLRSLRSLQTLQTLQTLRTIRSIRVLNSIRAIRVLNPVREIRVQKQNVVFCVELYSFFIPLLFTYSAGVRRTFHSGFLHPPTPLVTTDPKRKGNSS